MPHNLTGRLVSAGLSRKLVCLEAVLLFSCCVMVVGPSGQLVFDAQLREIRLCNSPARVVSGRPSGNMSLHLHSSAMRLKKGVQPG